MTRNKFIGFIAIAFMIFAISAIIISNITSNDKISKTQKDFNQFTDKLFLSDVSANAFNLHFYLKNPTVYGIETAPNIIGSINYEDMKNSESYYLNLINTLKAFDYDKLSHEGKITYDILMHYLSTELAFPDVCLNYELLSPTVGIQAQLPVLLSQYTFDDEYDVVTYLELLNSLPTYFNEILNFQKVKSENGTFMSTQTADDVIAQCTSFIEGKGSFLIETFNERIDKLPQLSKKQKSQYISKNNSAVAEKVIPAYQTLIKGLSSFKSTCKNNLGLCYYENGKNYYQYLVASYTGSSRTINDIESMIENRLRADYASLTSLSKDTDVYNDILEHSSSNNTASPEKILDELIEKTEAAFPTVSSEQYTVSYVPKSLEEHLSPAFYLSPQIDDPHNNQIFINNSKDYSDEDLYATLAHEGYPGHLYQTTYFYQSEPPLIRHLLNFGGYTEGWATYVELYSYSFRYDNPDLVKALKSSTSYSLALYCLADIGINYHGWNFEDTCSYFAAHGIDDKTVIKEIFDAMIAEPANYLQYYVGYLEILELKSQMKELHGDAYSDLAFHTYILEMGPAPFDVLEKYMR